MHPRSLSTTQTGGNESFQVHRAQGCGIINSLPSPQLDRLFAEHAQAVYGFLAYRVGDPTVAEDLLGDTFERIVRSHKKFDKRKGSEKAWIYTIALNCLRDHARREKTEREAQKKAHPGEEPVDIALARFEKSDEVIRALAQLGPAEREIVALRYGADLRLQDIATVTGLPVTTVNGRLYSGLRKLRELLDPAATRSSESTEQ